MNLRRDGVLDEFVQELVGVEHIIRPCVVNLKVQVGGCGMTRIAAKRNKLPSANRYVKRRQAGICVTSLMLVLITAQGGLDTWRKRLQVTIDRRLPRGMGDVYGIAKAILSHCDT